MKRASQQAAAATVVAKRLRERSGEIEQAALLRVNAVSAMPRAGGSEYAEGLRAAVSTGIAYGLEAIERGEQSASPVPEALLSQARLAARSGVSLDTVLRRYFAGHTLLEDFIVEEAARAESLGPADLKRLLRSQAAIVNRLLKAVSRAYVEEQERRKTSAWRRRSERIERLLDGEPLDTTDLGYNFGGVHLGMVACGLGAEEVLAGRGDSPDVQLLSVRRDEGMLWAWFGSKDRLDFSDIPGVALPKLSGAVTLAVGEPEVGISGWRLTHRQARAALSVALRSGEPFVRYADVALIASVLQDDLLAISLRTLYLEPLARARNGGAVLRKTLRAYFAAGRQVSSAAAVLGIDRHTVSKRIRAGEERIGRPLDECAADLEMALRLDEFE